MDAGRRAEIVLTAGATMELVAARDGAAEQLARWWHRNPDISMETVVDGVMTVIWAGLQNRLEHATS